MSQEPVQRPRYATQIQGVDEYGGGLDLAAAFGAEEAMELFRNSPSSPLGLVLEGAECRQVTLSVDHLFHGGRAESADQLILEVCDADVKTEFLHIGATEVGAETGSLETTPEGALLSGVAEARQSDVETRRPEDLQEGSDVRRTPDWHNDDALSLQIPTPADR